MNVNSGSAGAEARTIRDFGRQWLRFRDNDGYYGSTELFADLFSPLVEAKDIANCRVADIGSGTGRIVNMLLDCGVAHVVAVEPSSAVEVLRENVRERAEKVTVLDSSGEDLPAKEDVDFVFSVGVLHHVPDPLPIVRAAHAALRDGGKLAVWVYGREGNRLYLLASGPLRAITSRLPHRALMVLSAMMYPLLALYIQMCRLFPLPMHRYMTSHFGRLSRSKQLLTIYDQLNPAYARYYTRREAEELLKEGGFEQIKCFHRHHYSWSLVGVKTPPASKEP